MRRWAAVVGSFAVAAAVHVACSSDAPESDPSVPLPDRGDPPEASPDVAIEVDAGPCDRNKPFGAPSHVPGLDAVVMAATPRLSPDELTIYFTGRAEAGSVARLMRARRTSLAAPFGPSEIISSPSSMSNDNDPMVSADELSLWFHSGRSGNADVYSAIKTGADYGAASPVTAVNTDAGEAHAYFWQSGSQLWFTSNRGGSWDIYTSTGKGFGPAKVVTELSSPSDDWQPMITEDGLTVVFASNRDGGAGGYDLYLAERLDVAKAFGAPKHLAEVSSADNDFTGWISADRCRLYFSSDRDAPGVRHMVYVAVRPR